VWFVERYSSTHTCGFWFASSQILTTQLESTHLLPAICLLLLKCSANFLFFFLPTQMQDNAGHTKIPLFEINCASIEFILEFFTSCHSKYWWPGSATILLKCLCNVRLVLWRSYWQFRDTSIHLSVHLEHIYDWFHRAVLLLTVWSVWLAQLVKSLAASACSLTQEVTGSTLGADGLTYAIILSRSDEMSSN
jgi:hypothetical protein